MDQYKAYRNSLKEFEQTLGVTLGKDVSAEFEKFALACVFRAWGNNGMLYSPKYKDIVAQIFEKEMGREEIEASMQAFSVKDKKPAVPGFFKELVDIDLDRSTEHAKSMLGALYEFFALMALLNGDFTMEEAEAIDGIIAILKNYANASGLKIAAQIPEYPKTITGRSDSYLAFGVTEGTSSQNRPGEAEDPSLPNEPAPTPEKNLPNESTLTLETDEVYKAAGRLKGTEDLLDFIGGSGNLTDTLNASITQLHKRAEELSKENGLGLSLDDFAKANGLTGGQLNVQTSNGLNDKKPEPVEEELPERSDEAFQALMDELNGLVGLTQVKEDVRTLLNFIKINKMRAEREMKVPTISYHLVFTGNPGTGKTTVARIIAKLYYQMGILPKGQLVEADRGSLVAGYLGQTAIKTQEVIDRAMGGVLFIDEAYSLANDEQDSYGKEAIETLLKAMEDHRDELVVIVAGYTELMHKFINSNPGLNSRFNKYFLFPDYTGPELKGIFDVYCKNNGYKLAEEVAEKLEVRFGELYENRNENFGNGRDVRNIFEKAINHQANRLAEKADVTDEDLQHLAWEDLEKAMEKSDYEIESEKIEAGEVSLEDMLKALKASTETSAETNR